MNTVNVIVCSRYGIVDVEVYEEATDAFYRYYEVAEKELGVPLEDISMYTAESLVEYVEEYLQTTGHQLIWEQDIQVK